MNEKILAIEEYRGKPEGRWCTEAGFTILTDRQRIVLAIDDESACCEEWGYFLTEDDTSKFIGAELLGIELTDTNRSNRKFQTDWLASYTDDTIFVDEGSVMFVNILTNRGTLQFVAYNSHNGYYGHNARVSSIQLQHEDVL